VPLTIAQAITRLTASQQNPFLTKYGTMSSPQQVQRINEILDTWYTSDSWRGVRKTVDLTSVLGIITLPATYLRVEKRIAITSPGCCGWFYDIKPMEWQFQTGGPGWFDPERCCIGAAIDLGDNSSGQRQYQLTGDTDTVDSRTYTGLARLRYNFTTDTSTPIIPDCYTALEISARAMRAMDTNATGLAQELWGQAFARLDSDLGQYQMGDENGVLQLDPSCALGITNIV